MVKSPVNYEVWSWDPGAGAGKLPISSWGFQSMSASEPGSHTLHSHQSEKGKLMRREAPACIEWPLSLSAISPHQVFTVAL